MVPHVRAFRFLAAALLGLAGVLGGPLGGSGRAAAGEACPLRLVPEDASAAWKDAARKAAARLAGLASPHDCRSVEVIVGPDGGATLAFLTTDGRGAARALETPADLAPALEALLVTLPAPRPLPAQASTGQASSEQPSSDRPSSDKPSSEQPSPGQPFSGQAPSGAKASSPGPSREPVLAAAPSLSALHLLVGASAGGRLVGSQVAFASPAFALHASVLAERWELGLVADYAPLQQTLGQKAPEGFSLWTFSTGLSLGRRDAVGAGALGYGLAIGVQSISEGATLIPGVKAPRSLEVAHPRLGVYGKVAYPERARVRFTGDLGLDVVLSHLPDKAARERQLPGMPRFGLALSLGVEAAIL